MIPGVFVQRIDWRGITLEVSYDPSWLRFDAAAMNVAHIQVSAISPARASLPISETGFKSQFLDPDDIQAHGGPVAFVRSWLDHEAAAPGWIQQELDARQGCLF